MNPSVADESLTLGTTIAANVLIFGYTAKKLGLLGGAPP